MRAGGWVVAAWCCALCWALQRPACPPDAGARCVSAGGGHAEYIYYIDGKYLKIEFTDGGYYYMECPANVTLDDSALPRFASTLRVTHVKLSSCSARGAYAAALDALGVRAAERVTLDRAGHVTRLGLRGLERLRALTLVTVSLAPDAFESTPRLERLRLNDARPAPLHALPTSLTELQLVRTGVELLSRDALARFPNLTSLIVRDDTANVSVQARAPLRSVALMARDVRVHAELPASLQELTLHGAATLGAWRACAGLRTLTLVRAAEAPAPRWVSRCPALAAVSLSRSPALVALAPDALAGARALRRLTVSGTSLVALPVELLDEAPALEYLDLSDNRLRELPGGMFSLIKNLTSLNLAGNNLTNEVFKSVSVISSLQQLRLDNNVQLGDACSGGVNAVRGTSPLETLKQLSALRLRNTGARYVCRDWRERLRRLTLLDLADNRVAFLTYSDVQFYGSGEVRVELSGNNVSALVYERSDYEALRASRAACEPASRAHLVLDARAALRCDCGATWAARALRACPAHVRVRARCAGGGELGALAPGELRCAAPCPAAVPRACRCSERERVPRPALVRRVDCTGAGLVAAPVLARQDGAAWELLLAHNHIARVSPADLPPVVIELDLRNNSLQDVTALTSLLVEGRNLSLGHNPLACTCSARGALSELSERRHLVRDYRLVCAELDPASCGAVPRALLALGLAPALLGAALLLACAARPAWRRRVKLWARALGCWPGTEVCEEEEDDAERPYDVFVSFSHGDAEVAAALVARLEARGYRVCVHYRDWAPGGWIPAQIAASVRRARRTVALVSPHFLRSTWARAEFREALQDAAPRLLVVLLADAAALELREHAELGAYLAQHTYVRWGERWFWSKLCAALPPPRARPPGDVTREGDAPGDVTQLQLSARTLSTDVPGSS